MSTPVIKSFGRIPLSPEEIIHRAKWCVGKLTYSLEQAGGRDPKWPLPARPGTRSSDCIGMVFWAFGLDRYQPDYPHYGGHINTDSLIMDAVYEYTTPVINQTGKIIGTQRHLGTRKKFSQLTENTFPHMLVVGSKKIFGHGPRMGHIGVVIEPGRVIHCNGSRNGCTVGAESWWMSWPKFYRIIPREDWKARPPTEPPPIPTKKVVSG